LRKILKKSLKIPKGQSESIYQRRTDNTMAKRKSIKHTLNKPNRLVIKSSLDMFYCIIFKVERLWWLRSYVSWTYHYLCNQCLSPLKLRVRIPLMGRCTRYNIMLQSLSATCNRLVVFSGTPVSTTNITVCDYITKILLKVTLNTKTQTHI
jgi:hypothetical protein